MLCKVFLMTAVLAIFGAQFLAADPQTCQEVDSLDYNNTNFVGTWYEVARNPAPSAACIEISISLYQNSTNISYFGLDIYESSSNVSTYQDNQLTANITLLANATATSGQNVTLTKNGSVQSPITVKILSFNATTNFIVGCSYPVGSNVTTGFILAKAATPNATLLSEANNNAALSYTSFVNGSYSNVTNTNCYRSSASQALPVISGLLALIMVLINRH